VVTCEDLWGVRVGRHGPCDNGFLKQLRAAWAGGGEGGGRCGGEWKKHTLVWGVVGGCCCGGGDGDLWERSVVGTGNTR